LMRQLVRRYCPPPHKGSEQTMGGRAWWYLTDYDGDASAALVTLRTRVFKEGEYFFDGVPQDTIARLLDAAGDEGTSSILDIEAVAPVGDAGVAAPASWLLLQAAFGTAQPTIDQARDEALRLAGMLPRWRCVYFPLYENGAPVKWCFAGSSGETAENHAFLRRSRGIERSTRATFRPPALETRVARPIVTAS
jgi:hypothetical protein